MNQDFEYYHVKASGEVFGTNKSIKSVDSIQRDGSDQVLAIINIPDLYTAYEMANDLKHHRAVKALLTALTGKMV